MGFAGGTAAERPTLAGDTIHVEVEVTDVRPTSKNDGRGLVRTRNRVLKQDGSEVLRYTPLRMVKGRSVQHGG